VNILLCLNQADKTEREMLKRVTTAHNFANQLLNLYLESRATPGVSASLLYKQNIEINKHLWHG
jgi:hypothetical protein